MRYYPLLAQVFRFGMVGLTASGIQFCTVVFLVQYLSIAPLVANVLAFFISFQMSYWGHRLWTFNSTQTVHSVAASKLLFVQLLNLAANETLFYIFLTLHLPYQVALILTLAILPIFTFISSKWWVFR